MDADAPAETVGDLKALADDHRRRLVHPPSVELHTCGRADPVKPTAKVRSVSAADAWAAASRGEARLLDLRTAAERRYGWPPSAPRVSLTRHIAAPGSQDTIYLCQHANRSKLTGWRGAAEVEGAGRRGSALASPVRTRPSASPDKTPHHGYRMRAVAGSSAGRSNVNRATGCASTAVGAGE